MIQDIDNHIDSFSEAEVAEGLSQNALKLFSICNAWRKVRPIVKFAHGLVFFKPKWQKALDEFIHVADGICPEIE